MSDLPPGERGRLRVATRVLNRIAARAARDGSRPVLRARASVRRRRKSTDVRIRLAAAYPSPLPEAAAAADDAATAALATLAGVPVGRVRIVVTDLQPTAPPPGTPPRPPLPATAPAARRAPRHWGERRLPTALVALAGTVACGGWLVLQHRSTSRPARLATALTAHQVDDPPVLAGAVLLAAVGVTLLVLALSGSRTVGRFRPPPGGTPLVVDVRPTAQQVHRMPEPSGTVTATLRGRIHTTTQDPAGRDGPHAGPHVGPERRPRTATSPDRTPRPTAPAPRTAAPAAPLPPPRSPEEP
ncbi:hypothetical protein ACFV6F_01665 [Kitasatospora phosalacinea]|uniref:hypothetical protein n=1 Tax=Kitasatospora phosalacinea TaxID=2065 RepID=UPI0036480EA3